MANLDLLLHSNQLQFLLRLMAPEQLSDLNLKLNPPQIDYLMTVLTPEQEVKVRAVFAPEEEANNEWKYVYDFRKRVDVQQLLKDVQFKHLEEELEKAYTKMEDESSLMKLMRFPFSCFALFCFNLRHRFYLLGVMIASLFYCFLFSTYGPYTMELEEVSKFGPISKAIVHYLPLMLFHLAFIAAMAIFFPTGRYFNFKMYFLCSVLIYLTSVFARANIGGTCSEAFSKNSILRACIILAPFLFGPAALTTMIIIAYSMMTSVYDRNCQEALDNVKFSIRGWFKPPRQVREEIARLVGRDECKSLIGH